MVPRNTESAAHHGTILLSEDGSRMKAEKNILIVEDETDLAELIQYNLQKEGYKCRCAADGQKALKEIQSDPPDMILLDRMLPGMSGDELISQLKRHQRYAGLPIIMLTAKAEESDQLVGFTLGADDYITKPFSMKLLLVRVEALFRRLETIEDAHSVLTAGPICLDADRYEVTVHGQAVNLTATEFRLLKILMAAKGRVLSRGHLIDTVMGTSVAVTDRTIDVHITSLRRKLGKAADWVQTIRGVGYTFRPPG